MSNIYLIGMPASGKSTLGKKLADKLSFDFIDINTEIEKEALMFLDELYERYGQEAVSLAETNLLINFKDKKNTVFALNDAVINTRKNKKLLNGKIIYLDVDEKELMKRLKNLYPKNIFENITLSTMLEERFLKYRTFANYIIDNNSNDLNKVIEEITSLSW